MYIYIYRIHIITAGPQTTALHDNCPPRQLPSISDNKRQLPSTTTALHDNCPPNVWRAVVVVYFFEQHPTSALHDNCPPLLCTYAVVAYIVNKFLTTSDSNIYKLFYFIYIYMYTRGIFI